MVSAILCIALQRITWQTSAQKLSRRNVLFISVTLQVSSLRPLILLVLLITVRIVSAYFEYKSDCDALCQTNRLPCMISEIATDYFPCWCEQTNDACMETASPTQACLLVDGRVFGGEKIWVAYDNFTHHHPTPKPDPPAPQPKPRPAPTRALFIYASIVSVILVIRITVDIIQVIRVYLRRRHYDEVNNEERMRRSGVPLSPESPYHTDSQ